mmetsp:Transcript_61620/g.144457  ORF Transcript_61620/g.144457 Transcript_61620/m.144457 type:complete len:898 (+) Transcript_61620:69-2762(+)
MSLHARPGWQQAWLLVALLSACSATEELDSDEAAEREKPHVLRVIEEESKKPEAGVEIRVLQRHGRAPVPPAPGRTPTTDEELMREFDEVTVEWYTSELVNSVLLRLPERQDALPKTNATYDGYKFFTGASNECKFQISDKHVLPDEHTQDAHNLADENMISKCVADNSDVVGAQSRRSAALLKLHPNPFKHHEAGWRYFTMLIRNPQKTPVRIDGETKMANTFQIVLNTTSGKTLVAMSFEALNISAAWVCSYTPWFKTTACTTACGGGFRTEVRRKLHAPPEGYDPKLLVNCKEAEERAMPCNQHECDVDCQLSEWTPWPAGACSRTCGNGTSVQRRYVVMGPKGNGKICPPWHTDGVRVRTVPCNEFPCEPSCSESPLAERYRAAAEASPTELWVEKEDEDAADEENSSNSSNVTQTSSNSTASGGEKVAHDANGTNASANGAGEADRKVAASTSDTTASVSTTEHEVNAANSDAVASVSTTEEASNEVSVANSDAAASTGATEEASNEVASDTVASVSTTEAASEEEEEAADDVNASLLSLGTGSRRLQAGSLETPRLEVGLAKSSCSEPCGGGRRTVLIPSEKKVSPGKADKSCALTFEEDCNMFPCSPLMLQPANPWQYPVAGGWFMLDISFVIEELAESFTIRAPPDFLLAATGDKSECFLVEHSLPNLESCYIFPGQVADRTGPIMVFNFSNPLEPQNSFTWKRDWYYLRTWVQHPKTCTGGTKDGRCLGRVGERQWVLSLRDSLPEPLWELVKGSYEIFANESDARTAFEANGAKSMPFTEDAEEVTTTTVAPATLTKAADTDKSKDATEAKAEKGKDGKDAKADEGGDSSDSLLEQEAHVGSISDAKRHRAGKRSHQAHHVGGHSASGARAKHHGTGQRASKRTMAA